MSEDALVLRGVVHLTRPLGRQVRTLQELRDAINEIEDASIFLHVGLDRLGLPDDEDPDLDDWSAWVRGVVQHPEAAERLSFAVSRHPEIDPGLRADAVAALDRIPEAERRAAAAPQGGALELLTLEPVTWDASEPLTNAHDVLVALRTADRSVWFWHLIEEPWRLQSRAPLLEWLEAHGASDAAERIEDWNRAGKPIDGIRHAFARWWGRHGLPARVAGAAQATPNERNAAGQQAVRSLVRRLRTGGDAA